MVTEALWKKKLVIAKAVGGIREQIQHMENGFLVKTDEDAIQIINRLLKDTSQYAGIKEKAHETVKEKFIMPVLLNNYLKLFEQININEKN